MAAEARVLNIRNGVADFTFVALAARRQDEIVLLRLHWGPGAGRVAETAVLAEQPGVQFRVSMAASALPHCPAEDLFSVAAGAVRLRMGAFKLVRVSVGEARHPVGPVVAAHAVAVVIGDMPCQLVVVGLAVAADAVQRLGAVAVLGMAGTAC